MSPDLIGMDQREYEVIKIEEAELKVLRDKNLSELESVDRTFMMIAVASFIGLAAGSFFKSPIICVSSVVVMAGSVVFFIAGHILLHGVGEREKKRDIDDNRLARLQNKVGVLEDKIAPESEFKEQFRAAKDFFKTKYDIYLGQRNRPITNVTTYVHSMHSKYKKA
jgi:hypothetical protein